jgi:hypothetical protein
MRSAFSDSYFETMLLIHLFPGMQSASVVMMRSDPEFSTPVLIASFLPLPLFGNRRMFNFAEYVSAILPVLSVE